MNLLEQYKNRIDVSEKYFQNTHAGQRLDGTKKVAIATCLHNINKFMNENFMGYGAGTNANTPVPAEATGLGTWKKFCLKFFVINVTNM